MLIDDLREHWHDPEMPFLLVQLAAFQEHSPENRREDAEAEAVPFAEFSPYALTREIQAEMPRARKQVGMIVSFDRGDHSDIHPRDKQTLGFRLARKAEHMVYGRETVCDGPEFAGFRQEGRQLRVFFRNVGSGLATSDGKAPAGFVLGDRSGFLAPAEAAIDGWKLHVGSRDVLGVYLNGSRIEVKSLPERIKAQKGLNRLVVLYKANGGPHMISVSKGSNPNLPVEFVQQ